MSSLREVHVPVSAAANGQMVPPRCLILGEVAISDTLLAQELGLHIQTVRNGTAALQTLTRQSCDIVLVDLHTPRVRGLAFLEAVANRRPPFAVIGVADPADIHQAVQGMRLGIFDVLPAPVCAPQLLAALRRALADRATRLKAANAADRGFPNLLGHSPAMAEVFRLISRVAPSRVTVLLEGETGTGKEQVARALHAGAPDRTGPFVPVNCAALPLTLLESELFGHVKGAFTDAVERRPGRLELADKGTLFLDEVSDIPLPMQAKLLRFLQERRFERLGGMDTLEVDVRVLGATHRCLRRLVRAGKFREDLYYRLNVVKIDVPPLRERPEDIALLARHFSARYAPAGAIMPISAEAMNALLEYPWPGNVRELENVIERSCVTAWSGPILPQHLPPEVFKAPSAEPRFQIDLERPLPEQVADLAAAVEQYYLRKALRKSQGRIGRCAEICGLSRRSVTLKMQEYRIPKPRRDEVT